MEEVFIVLLFTDFGATVLRPWNYFLFWFLIWLSTLLATDIEFRAPGRFFKVVFLMDELTECCDTFLFNFLFIVDALEKVPPKS